jgi:hypothetical protein
MICPSLFEIDLLYFLIDGFETTSQSLLFFIMSASGRFGVTAVGGCAHLLHWIRAKRMPQGICSDRRTPTAACRRNPSLGHVRLIHFELLSIPWERSSRINQCAIIKDRHQSIEIKPTAETQQREVSDPINQPHKLSQFSHRTWPLIRNQAQSTGLIWDLSTVAHRIATRRFGPETSNIPLSPERTQLIIEAIWEQKNSISTCH